ncbi:integrase catalytic domain-containing protein [Trichonephila inaurata madagascariensis]|uniref:Integrase catalytic domain-containing protein n=1 Tax=Trichonephila inaurata madagascariensis TaxID=2747483 RepID=A0A8X6X9L5_9ARAC|nr:integrase catalytic domain-containing protein [Trichonephila inaurata madagascariensis]
MCPEICINENLKNPRQEEKIENENGRDPTLSNAAPTRKVLLQTLVVRLSGENKMKHIRVLIDSGSSKSYLTNFAIKEMRYECIAEENLTHSLFGGKETAETHKRCLISLSDFSDKYRCNFEVLNQEVICSGILRIPRGNFIKEIKKHKIFLSDLNSQVDLLYQFSPDEIHGLIGADVLGKLYTGNIKQLKSDLVLEETRLGWTLMGKTDAGDSTDSTNSVMSLHVNDAKISDLWRLDTLGILDPGEKGTRQELEKAAEEHFNRKAYEGVFSEWLQEGVIEEVKNYCNDKSDHYLPHRAVIKENSTTRVRPVFDGSAREKNSPSINDCLEKRQNTVELIPAIMNRFRFKKIGVVADIRRAFLQIGLSELDRPYLKFLWWEEEDPAKPKVFQHRRVVFGLSCSPYLLGATIRFHLQNVPHNFEKTATLLLESFYVDNCVTSVDDHEELEKFIEDSKTILSTAKFELRGWEHSYSDLESYDLLPPEGKSISVLGLRWHLKTDSLTIDLRDCV